MNPIVALTLAHRWLLSGQPAEPPSSGLAGGYFPAPGWLILIAGGLVVVGAVVFLIVRAVIAGRNKS